MLLSISEPSLRRLRERFSWRRGGEKRRPFATSARPAQAVLRGEKGGCEETRSRGRISCYKLERTDRRWRWRVSEMEEFQGGFLRSLMIGFLLAVAVGFIYVWWQ